VKSIENFTSELYTSLGYVMIPSLLMDRPFMAKDLWQPWKLEGEDNEEPFTTRKKHVFSMFDIGVSNIDHGLV
jgi:hypothetical protein